MIGTTELIFLLVIVLLIFGAGKLPLVGKQLGAAISEFKNNMKPKDPGAGQSSTNDNETT